MGNDTKKQLSIWSCRAMCADKTTRVVTAYFYGRDPIMIGRPWLRLLHDDVLARTLRHLLRVMNFVVAVADYASVSGEWRGQVEISHRIIATLVGDGKNSIYRHIKELAAQGYILNYASPGWSRVPSSIFIPRVNMKTGLPLFAANPEWALNFITELEPTRKLYGLAADRLHLFPPPIKRFSGLPLGAENARSLWGAGGNEVIPCPANTPLGNTPAAPSDSQLRP